MKTLKDLSTMTKEPASKEWFAKHGLPKSITNHPMKKTAEQKALESKVGGVPRIKGSAAYNLYHHPEKAKAKADAIRKSMNSVKHKEPSQSEKDEYQRRIGRGYHE